ARRIDGGSPGSRRGVPVPARDRGPGRSRHGSRPGAPEWWFRRGRPAPDRPPRKEYRTPAPRGGPPRFAVEAPRLTARSPPARTSPPAHTPVLGRERGTASPPAAGWP